MLTTRDEFLTSGKITSHHERLQEGGRKRTTTMAANDFMLMESQQTVVFPGLSNKAVLYLHSFFWNYCPPYALISNLFKFLEEC